MAGGGAIKGRVVAPLKSFVSRGMDRQATQPAAVPSGRKRRRVSKKQKQEEEAQARALEMKARDELEMAQIGLSRAEAEALEMKFNRDLEMAQSGLSRAKAEALDKQATQPPTSELMVALKALSKAEDPLPPPTPSPINELMEGTLKDYEEECVEEGTFHSDPATEVWEWEVLDQMDTQFNQLLYESCPFHPHRFLECVNPQSNFGPLRFKCPQEGCPVYLFEDTREVMMEKLKEDTHPQVHARVKRGELKCRCGFVPKMKLSRTAKNYNKVFFSCGSFLTHAKPCGYFQWLHGPLWCPREQAQPTLRRWVKDKPVPLLKGKSPEMEKPRPWGMHAMERSDPEIEKMRHSPWLKQFGDSIQAQEYERRRRQLYGNFGSSCLF